MKIKILSLKKVGKNFKIDPFSKVILPNRFKAGDNVFIGPESYISADVEFMDNVMVGPRLTIIGGDHDFGIKGQYNRFLKSSDNKKDKVIIGKDSWIGVNVTILKGVEIGDGSIIGAGSLVTKSVPPYTIAFGTPCINIKDVFNSDLELREHLILLNYDLNSIDTIFQKRK
jgi:acetyltransferase-like isoleucine patch superfamily enzyme